MEKIQPQKAEIKPKIVYSGPLAEEGVVEAPQTLPKVTLYSYSEAQKWHDQLRHDIYVAQKKSTANKQKIPPIIKILGGILGIGYLVYKRKNITSFITELFSKKTP